MANFMRMSMAVNGVKVRLTCWHRNKARGDVARDTESRAQRTDARRLGKRAVINLVARATHEEPVEDPLRVEHVVHFVEVWRAVCLHGRGRHGLYAKARPDTGHGIDGQQPLRQISH